MGKIIQPLGSIDQTFSKQEIDSLAQLHGNEIIEKGYDLLTVYVELKRYLLYLDTILKTIQPQTLSKAVDKGEKSFDYSNARVTVINRTKYNFENDHKWQELDQQLRQLKELKKQREGQLKQVIGETMEIVDKETGEVEQLVAPMKEMIQQLMIKL